MKRLLLVGATALSTCLGICAMLVVAVPAWAHVVVSPEEVAADDYETLTVSVPTEKEVPYLHSPIEFPRVHVLQEAASAVIPGGLLLIVDHASVSPRSWADPEETLAPLDLSPHEWRTERLEAREREATRPNGQRATVTDNVIAVRRLAR